MPHSSILHSREKYFFEYVPTSVSVFRFQRLHHSSRRSTMNISAKSITEILLILLVLLLMAAPHTGSVAHEWLGVLLTAVFLAHTWLNRAWYKSLSKGRYNSTRTLRLALNVLLLLAMAGTLTSAVLISRTVFAFAGLKGELFFRAVHVFCAHWCFILAAVHLGLYSKRFCFPRKQRFSFTPPVSYRLAAYGMGIVVAAYGIHAFLQRELIYPLTLRSSFMLWSENTVIFLLEYSSIFFLFVWLTIIFSLFPQTTKKYASLFHQSKIHKPFP